MEEAALMSQTEQKQKRQIVDSVNHQSEVWEQLIIEKNRFTSLTVGKYCLSIEAILSYAKRHVYCYYGAQKTTLSAVTDVCSLNISGTGPPEDTEL